MNEMWASMLDIGHWVANFGLWAALIAIGILVFAESGLLIGVFLPGDSLLFACGIFVAQGDIPLFPVLAVVFLSAIIGDNAGYLFGRTAGHRLLEKRSSRIFRKKYLQRAEAYFEKYGQKTVLFARFIPYVRTFMPVVAGIARMRRRWFIIYNAIGALLWTLSTVLIGYWLGKRIVHLQHYVVPALLAGMLIIFGPALWHIWGVYRRRRRNRS